MKNILSRYVLRVPLFNLKRSLAVAVGILLIPSAGATVLLTEEYPTAYGDGTGLGNNVTTGGYNTKWPNGNSAGTGNSICTSAGAQTYPGLMPISSSASYGLRVSTSTSRNTVAPFTSQSGDGNSVYWSFLIKVTAATPTARQLGGLRNSTGSGNLAGGVGINASRQIQLYKNNAVVATGATLDQNTTYFVVLRYKFQSGADEVALWLDPATGQSAESGAGVTPLTGTAGSDQSSLLSLQLLSAADASGALYLDEHRVTTTWAEATLASCFTAAVNAPTNQSVYENQTATFAVIAGGSSPTNQWELSTDNGGTWSSITDATNASYTTGTLALSDSGKQYRCIVYVTCDHSSVTSAPAILTVNACTSAGISADPTNITVTAGSVADFYMTATGSGPAYQWQFSTNSGTDWSNVGGGTGGTTTHYITATTVMGDDGKQYHCIVTTPCDGLSVTSQVATLTVNCSTVGIATPPTGQNAAEGAPATFSLVASGSLPAYQWQTNNGVSGWVNIDGATSASYTTPATVVADSGLQFQCIVSVACNGSSVTSAPVTLQVFPVSAVSYRSAGAGNWGTPGTWEWSFDNGANWSIAGVAPNDANNTNILVRTNHTVIVAAAVQADQLTVELGGTVVVNGGTLTIAHNAASAYDLDVAGTLEVDSNNPLAFNTGATARFTGTYEWSYANNTGAIPQAANVTWDTNSTCEIDNGKSGTPPDNLAGQSFYNFYWNWPGSGQCNLAGNLTTVKGNLTLRGTSDTANSVRFLASANTTNNLVVGGDFIIAGGNITCSGGSTTNTVLNVLLGGNFTIQAGALDTRNSGAGSSANIIFANTNADQTFSNAGNITHTGTGGGCPINWKINSGCTLVMAGGNLTVSNANNGTRDAVTVDGTLNLGTSRIVGPGALIMNSTGTLVGNGTNQLTSGLYAITYGGTLSLPDLPILTDGESFKVFDATNNYGGSFAAIDPSIPATGLVWGTAQLAVNGTLLVGSVPQVTVSPASTNAPAGTTITFAASATGTPTLIYRWYDNASNVLSGVIGAELTLTNVQPASAGNYTVVVSNSFGSASSSAALTVSSASVPPELSGGQVLGDGTFQLNFSGPNGQAYEVLASTNVTLPLISWDVVASGTFAGPTNFTDASVTNYPTRFYIIVSP
jgi:hypothetical protein